MTSHGSSTYLGWISVITSRLMVILQGMTNNVGLTFSVGETTLQFIVNIEQHDQSW